jgi:peptide/nickel transport system permease protein
LIQRVAALIGILVVISVGCFYLVHLLPGNPAVSICLPGCTPATIAQIDHQLGLDKPIYEQYFVWLGHVLHGNLGVGSASREPVSTLIGRSFKLDLELIIISQAMAFLVAVPLSVYSARRAGGKLDQASTATTFALFCLPSFVIVIWVVKYLTVDWHLFPGVGSDPFSGGGSFLGSTWLGGVQHNIDVLLLPSIVLALGSIAIYFRLLRSEMVFTLQEEYITAARSKGLTTNRILWRHAVRPSSITTLTSAGNNIALLITGLFIVELKFGLPGLGSELIYAVYSSDYLTIQGIALVAAVAVVIANFAIDLITPFVDPRIARA